MVQNIKLGDIWHSCNKIRAAIFRFPLNIWDVFKPVDPNASGLVSESTFVGILSGQLKSLIGLSDSEILNLSDYFRVQDGRILYSQLCEVIHGNEPKLAEKPLITGLEWQDPDHVNRLSKTELRKLKLIITQIAINVNKRKIALRPYFQDYELITKNSGNITITHFARILNFLGIIVAPEEFSLLIKRYERHAYTINYVAFIKDIEDTQNFMDEYGMLHVSGDLLDQFPGRIITAELPKLPRPEVGKILVSDAFKKDTIFHPALDNKNSHMTIVEIIHRIQRHVLERRLSVKNFFTHFDILNTGKVSICQFRRGLDSMQLSSIGKLHLTEDEINQLIILYKDPNDNERVYWKLFEDDINHVFTTAELEKMPNLRIDPPGPEIINLPEKGRRNWIDVSNNTRELCEQIIIKIRHRIEERKMIIKPLFKDYDKLNHGHVSRNQLRQILGTAGILLASEELFALEQRYNDDRGFNYGLFLNDIEASPITVPYYNEMLEEKKLINFEKPAPVPTQDEKDIVLILAKIKAKVIQQRIKVTEFLRPFDTHNEMSIKRDEFVRGVDQLRCVLSKAELETIMDIFKAPFRPGYVEYERFANAIEEAVTIGQLEKSPLLVPCQHITPGTTTTKSFLNYQERQTVAQVMDKLVKIYSPNYIDLFKDFDKTNSGTVTREQLMKVLSIRKSLMIMSLKEFDIIYKCFCIDKNGRIDFNYRAFLEALDYLKTNNKRLPN
ncbi:uncharacterized protein LOC122859098 isoform X1 [Aphidius gifuensis]|uniref:uncharacterized protein LOC122859098 isoform X1 n=1 Tax=Aphidius gifuensis TaxID=684658 RepID=UPI001CDD37CC|nr:uncharacterized protein LOC122859098 isoform X1 [Aphidius gifuensis]